MSYILDDFRCIECGEEAEHLVKSDGTDIPTCPECLSPSLVKLVSAGHLSYIGMATDKASSDAMTTSVTKWDKARRQKMRIEARNQERHGTYV